MPITTFEEQLAVRGQICFTNVGRSMMPLLREGRDIMVIDKKGAEPCKNHDAVLFKRYGVHGRGAYVMHRILRVNKDGTYWIVGDACIKGETVNEDQILGILTAVIRDGKRINVTDKKYRLYVFFVASLWPLHHVWLYTRNFFRRVISKLKRIFRKKGSS